MGGSAAQDGNSSSRLHATLLEFFSAPGKYQLSLRQPPVLFGSVREVLQIAAGRGSGADTPDPDESLREAARFFVRVALLYPGADHYAVLGLPPREEPVELKERYRLLMRLTHPDFARGSDPGWPADAAVRVNRAYETLSSPMLRRDYNEQLASLNAARPSWAPAGGSRRPSQPERGRAQLSAPLRRTIWAAALCGLLLAAGILVPRTEPVQLVQKRQVSLAQSQQSQPAVALPARAPEMPAAPIMPGPAGRAAALGSLAASRPPTPPPLATADADTPVDPAPAAPGVAAGPVAAASSDPPVAHGPASRTPLFTTSRGARADAPEVRKEAPVVAVAPIAVPTPAPVPRLPDPPRADRIPIPMTAPRRVPESAPLPDARLPRGEVAPRPSTGPLPEPKPAPREPPVLAGTPPQPPALPSAILAKPATAMPPSAGPSLLEAQPLLNQLLQTMESGRGEQLLQLLEPEARQAPAARALSSHYDRLVGAARPVRLAHVEFQGEPRAGLLLVTGRIRLHAGEPTIGSPGEKLLVRAEFAARSGKVYLKGLSGGAE